MRNSGLSRVKREALLTFGKSLASTIRRFMFLGGINLKQFLSDYKEWHALVEGFCDVFLPFVKGHQPSKELKEAIEKEHHYYNVGRVLGFIAWVWFWIVIYKVVT